VLPGAAPDAPHTSADQAADATDAAAVARARSVGTDAAAGANAADARAADAPADSADADANTASDTTDAGATDAGAADPSTRPQLLRRLRIGNKRRVREPVEVLQSSGGRWQVPGRLPHRLLPAGSHAAAGSHTAANAATDAAANDTADAADAAPAASAGTDLHRALHGTLSRSPTPTIHHPRSRVSGVAIVLVFP